MMTRNRSSACVELGGTGRKDADIVASHRPRTAAASAGVSESSRRGKNGGSGLETLQVILDIDDY